MRKIGKIEIPDLDNQFEGKAGRMLIMDGDAACYEAAYKYKKLDTAIRCVHTKILEAMFLTNSKTARVHITPKGCTKCNRANLNTVLPYQGNRKGTPKPPLLEPLRQCIQGLLHDDNIEIVPHYDIEADDGIVYDSYTYANSDIVVWSADKDLRCVPCCYYDISTGRTSRIPNRFGYVGNPSTGMLDSSKLQGHGTKFFWWQMLMGDTADNVRGLQKCDGKSVGKVRGFGLIQNFKDEAECAEFVLRKYLDIGQNPYPEGEAMWLHRWEGDSFVGYVKEVLHSHPILDELREYEQTIYKE